VEQRARLCPTTELERLEAQARTGRRGLSTAKGPEVGVAAEGANGVIGVVGAVDLRFGHLVASPMALQVFVLCGMLFASVRG